MDSIKHLPGGSERILFIDYDQAIVFVTARMLERLGYSVSTDTSSIKALTKFQAHPEAFDLLITRMIMPDMSGFELSQIVLGMRPDLPIIFSSDFKNLSIEKDALDKGIKAFIHKPFMIHDLAVIVRKVLDNKKGELESS